MIIYNRQIPYEEIEKAAKEAIGQDRTEYGQLFKSSASTTNRPPPPPPSRPRDPNAIRRPGASKDPDSIDSLREDDSGVYTIRGQTYLEGKLHEDKMRAGVSCEIFVDALDRWIAASITKLNVVFVPNTEIVMKTFSVEYKYATEEEVEVDADAGQDTTEEDVKSDRLRLLVDSDLRTKEMAAKEEAVAVEVAKVIDTHTGLGGWSTVSVNVYDEEEEAAKREALLREEDEERFGSVAQNESLKRAQEFAEDDNDSVCNLHSSTIELRR